MEIMTAKHVRQQRATQAPEMGRYALAQMDTIGIAPALCVHSVVGLRILLSILEEPIQAASASAKLALCGIQARIPAAALTHSTSMIAPTPV